MKIIYKRQKFYFRSIKQIEKANEIIENYLAQGLRLTVRQLYYRFVAAGLIPNNQKSYKNFAALINNARMAGYISWLAIEDRTRFLRGKTFWESPEQILDNAYHAYKRNSWEYQNQHIEVWVEKDAMLGVLQKACSPVDVYYMSDRGYVSSTALWEASRRLKEKYEENGTGPIVIYLGDFDPSGLDMVRDIQDRLVLFGDTFTKVKKIALSKSQIKKYDPPPNPVKITDSRAKWYIQEYGNESWELDALEPNIIIGLIQAEVKKYINEEMRNKSKQQEAEELDYLKQLVDGKEETTIIPEGRYTYTENICSCSACGFFGVESSAKFCPNCGRRIK
jgi:hypothetical protein